MIYYNDSDPFVCAWLKNLIAAKLLPAGDVDERPIEHVQASDVAGYTQCHFFAGIGGWPYALQLAGWGDRPVWTGSCPCPAFSVAGRGRGFSDPRHLWPQWVRLIRECDPAIVFGEQVDGAIGHHWLDLVASDLEAQGYAFAATVLGAHSAGAPHRRQRLWFVAHATGERRAEAGENSGRSPERPGKRSRLPLAHAPLNGREPRRAGDATQEQERRESDRGGEQGRIQHAPEQRQGTGRREQLTEAGAAGRSVDQWTTEPSVGRVAHGIPARVGRLCALGNAIVPQVAAAFVSAYMDVCAMTAASSTPQGAAQ